MQAAKKIFAVTIAIVAIGGMVFGVFGLLAARSALDSVGATVTNALGEIDTTATTTKTSIANIEDLVTEINEALANVEGSLNGVADTIETSQPALIEASSLMSTTIPTSIETVQEVLPNLISVTGSIDEALTTLDSLGIDETIGGETIALDDISVLGITIPVPEFTLPEYRLNYDLDFGYDPENAFDDSLIGIEKELDGVPDQVRTISVALTDTTENLTTISQDVRNISSDIGDVSAVLNDAPASFGGYLVVLDEVQLTVDSINRTVGEELGRIRLIISLFFLWIALTNLAPLYLAYQIFTTDSKQPATMPNA